MQFLSNEVMMIWFISCRPT